MEQEGECATSWCVLLWTKPEHRTDTVNGSGHAVHESAENPLSSTDPA